MSEALPTTPKLLPPLRRRQALAACWKPILLNWLLPGYGYWLIGERRRAKALFGVSLVFALMAFLQLTFGAVDGIKGGVYVPQLAPIQWMPTLGAAATAGVGPIYALFAWCFGGTGTEPVRNLTQEYGASYIMVAGLMNWLCCVDLFDRTTGRWVWRLPQDEQDALAGREPKPEATPKS
jgi:hypothetical protein